MNERRNPPPPPPLSLSLESEICKAAIQFKGARSSALKLKKSPKNIYGFTKLHIYIILKTPLRIHPSIHPSIHILLSSLSPSLSLSVRVRLSVRCCVFIPRGRIIIIISSSIGIGIVIGIMRIRKNAKLSSLLRSPPEAPLPSHVCQLNQSPWDVLPFSFPDALAPSSSSLAPQLDGGEDNFAANGSFGDSIGAVESSVASMMAVDAEEKTVIVDELEGRAYDRMNIDDGTNINGYGAQNGGDFDGDFSFKVCCNKTDGKRWQCKNEAVDGHYLCKHHLLQLKSYATAAAAADEDDDADADNADGSASRKLEKSSAFPGRRGGRPRGTKKSSSSSAAANSNQFYYYSGFGPSWGKRRSGRAGDPQGKPERRAGRPTPPRIGGEGIDYVDYDVEEEEEDEEDEDGDSGKKRMRKPVKARSLKSLM